MALPEGRKNERGTSYSCDVDMPQAADKGKIGFEQEEEENSCGRCNFNKEQEAREQAR